jgi:hypothetical protein
VDGDPSERIGDIRRVETVVKDGILYRSSDLYRALGVRADAASASVDSPTTR